MHITKDVAATTVTPPKTFSTDGLTGYTDAPVSAVVLLVRLVRVVQEVILRVILIITLFCKHNSRGTKKRHAR